MDKLRSRAQAIGAICIACILIASIYLMNRSNAYLEDNYDRLMTGWSVQINDTYFEDVDLSAFYFDGVNRGDYVRMETTLPAQEVDNPALRLYSIHSEVRVALNGTELYHYGEELNSQGRLLGYGYHYIDLGDDYGAGTLVIEFYVTEDNAFTSLETPEICNELTMFRDYVIQKKLPLAVNLFLIIFGICLLFVSLLFVRGNYRFGKLICVACFSTGIGCWSLCNYDLITLFTYNLRVKVYMEFLSLYISPLFVMLYFRQEAAQRTRAFRIAYYTGLIGQIVFIICAVSLQFANLVHFPAMLKFQHAILLLVCSVMLAAVVANMMKHKVHNKALLLGITVMVFIGVTDIIRFNLEKYHIVGGMGRYTSNLCLGALVFVLAQLIDFALEISHTLYEAARQETLERMAYVDSLTGIYNRRKCEEEYDKLENEDNYGIIAFDLNHLKRTNDTLGHDKGDELIRCFAQCLQKVFDGAGMTGRLGGDEFIVIFPDMAKVSLDNLIDAYEREMQSCRERMPELEISAAYGFCSKEEYPAEDARGIYRKADARMYAQKLSMKCQRKD